MKSTHGPHSTYNLDLRHLLCPLPVLKAKKFIKQLSPGEVLVVVATDPSSIADFRTFCEVTGHSLEECVEEEGEYKFYIKVKK
ncbi:MAG: sulfurtransferase TusA family protein [Pseudomonadota bacterium]|nr:sulfurtransferase TusA family protein [Pseudomonadota bacterium]